MEMLSEMVKETMTQMVNEMEVVVMGMVYMTMNTFECFCYCFL
jgi:hypothetical protein